MFYFLRKVSRRADTIALIDLVGKKENDPIIKQFFESIHCKYQSSSAQTCLTMIELNDSQFSFPVI